MTDDEARKVGSIACGADGGCVVCAEALIDSLKRAFPEHAETFQETFDKEYQ